MITEVDNHFCHELLNNDELTIIDVRSAHDYTESHIPLSLNIDIMCNDAIERLYTLNKSKPYLICCTVGVRSKSAARIMVQLGFKKIYHLTDGIISYADLFNRLNTFY